MTDATTTVATDAGSQTAAPAASAVTPDATTATLLTGTQATTPPATDDAAAKATAEAKAAEEAKAAAAQQGAPEKYEAFTLPDGFDAKPEQMEAFGTLARELNLSQANAQKLVTAHTQAFQNFKESQENAYATQIKAWREASAADKEFGGASVDANAAIAIKALQQFGTPELTKYLHETGLGNHPEIVRAFYRVGKALGEDGHIQGGVTAKAKDDRELFYGATMRPTS